MRLPATAWYVFGLLVAAAIAESAITYVPEARAAGDGILAIASGLACVAGMCAVYLTVLKRRNPLSPIFGSKRAAAIALGLAAILAVVVIFGVIG